MRFRQNYLNQAILFSLGLKLLYLIFGNLLPGGWHGWEHLFDVMARNDSGWYHQIARDWYPDHPPAPGEQSAFPFFPLYPLLLGAVMKLTGAYISAATCLQLLITWIWIRILFSYFRLRGFDDRRAFQFSVLWQCIPWAYFFHVYYSELLFSSLLLWALSEVIRERPWYLFTAVFLLSLCRPTGVMMAAGMAFLIAERAGWLRIFTDRRLLLIFSLAGAPLAVGLWSVYLDAHCGDPLVFSHSQDAWGRAYKWPWEAFFPNGFWDVQLLSSIVILMLLATIMLMRRASRGEQLFVGLNLLFPLTTGAVTSFYRFFLVIPQVFEHLLSFLGRRWVWAAVILMLFNLWAFGYWVSVSGWMSF